MSVELTPRGSFGWKMPKLPPFLMNLFMRVAIVVYRVLGDRLRIWGQPLILITTVGAKTGLERRTIVCRFTDTIPNSWLVVASFGGSVQHPAWYFNLARNPDKVQIQISGRTLAVRASSLGGEERQHAWDHIVALAPGYNGYKQKTDRQIPIVRLTLVP